MFEVNVFNRTNKKTFVKKFNTRIEMIRYVTKVKYSKVLTLLSITDNSYLYD
ncbi:MAG: hypothetical protein IJY25_02545 [Bacilli bacterium]|nr:hypothetical protein [Bacilli bacterium]